MAGSATHFICTFHPGAQFNFLHKKKGKPLVWEDHKTLRILAKHDSSCTWHAAPHVTCSPTRDMQPRTWLENTPLRMQSPKKEFTRQLTHISGWIIAQKGDANPKWKGVTNLYNWKSPLNRPCVFVIRWHYLHRYITNGENFTSFSCFCCSNVWHASSDVRVTRCKILKQMVDVRTITNWFSIQVYLGLQNIELTRQEDKAITFEHQQQRSQELLNRPNDKFARDQKNLSSLSKSKRGEHSHRCESLGASSSMTSSLTRSIRRKTSHTHIVAWLRDVFNDGFNCNKRI